MSRSAYINSVNLKSGTDFPYLVLSGTDSSVAPISPGYRTMHWHDDLQFILVLQGAIGVRTLAAAETVRCGEAVFINSDVVHMIEQAEGCRYRSFIFPERFLYGYSGSPLEALARRITGNTGISSIHFCRNEPWKARVLDFLAELSELEDAPAGDFYCAEVMTRLNGLWLVMLKNCPKTDAARTDRSAERTRIFLRYINEHYAEEISLDDIAGSAGVSKSEAVRCFRQSLKVTPWRYLLDFRLAQAARLLEETSLPISEISGMTGFHQQSYFGKCFRERAGCSPKEYRSRRRQEQPAATGRHAAGAA